MAEQHPGDARRPVAQHALTPIGKLGFRGRSATPEEREHIFDSYFFEGPRRTPYLQQFFTLMVLSATIAALGLVNDSAAVVIGAMLVAPLMTPILAVAIAVVQGMGRRMVDSFLIVLAGAGVAILVGVAISLFAPTLRTDLPLPGEILARTEPNLVDLGIALAAGAAGGFVAVRTEASGALPGVGIAVALVPPLATVGLMLGLAEWDLALGALLLFTTNIVAIILAAGLVFVAAGFAAFRDATGTVYANYARVIIVVGMIIVAIPLLAHSLQRIEQQNAVASTADVVSEWAPDLRLTHVSVNRSTKPIDIDIAITGTGELPDPDALAASLANHLGRAVELEVVYVPSQIRSAEPG